MIMVQIGHICALEAGNRAAAELDIVGGLIVGLVIAI